MEEFSSLFAQDTLATLDAACASSPDSIVEMGLSLMDDDFRKEMQHTLHNTQIFGINSMALASPVCAISQMVPSMATLLLEHLAARIEDDGPALYKFMEIMPIVLHAAHDKLFDDIPDVDLAWDELEAASNDVFVWARGAFESTYENTDVETAIFEILGRCVM